MEQANQFYYSILSVFLFSLVINAYLQIKKFKQNYYSDFYWILAILSLIISSISYILAPKISYSLLTVANSLTFTSSLCIAFLFKSWNQKTTQKITKIILTTIIYSIFFEYIRIKDDFIIRSYFTIITLATIIAWQVTEILRFIKKNKSIHLTLIITILAIQLLMALLRLNSINTPEFTPAKNIYQENEYGLALRIIWSSSFLLLFIFIGNFFYEQLLIKEISTAEKLKIKQSKLNQKTHENKEITVLLKERETLIESLVLANKNSVTGALSASIAHELNQPIGAIQLNTEFIQMQLESNTLNNSNLSDFIKNISRDNQRASKIINALKDIFKNKEIQTAPTNINELIESLIPIIQLRAKNNSIKIDIDLRSKSITMINSNEFQQVILNLINNAIEALIDLSLLEKKITIQTLDIKDHLELRVSDNGKGIPEKLKNNLFSLMKTSKDSGMGLGLWLTKHIIERHNGEISYTTAPEKTEFLIKLPIAITDQYKSLTKKS